MQERNAKPRRGLGHVSRAAAIDAERLRFFGFGFVHRGISGGVDHNVRSRAFEFRDDGGAVPKVERRPAERNALSLSPGPLDERGRHLTLRPGDRDADHSNSSGASLSRGKRRSLSERTGPPGSEGQETPISGSSQTIPRSLAAE